jgi:pSer/pThr/pTyr-binding forkhead associated (FHA) protein
MGAGQIAITVILNGRVMQKLSLAKDRILIGRSADSDVRINHAGVSRSHAVVTAKDGAFFVEDLESSNGTLVNGKRVRSVQLRNGDLVEVGSFSLHLRFAEGPKAANSPTADRLRDQRTVPMSPSPTAVGASPGGKPPANQSPTV